MKKFIVAVSALSLVALAGCAPKVDERTAYLNATVESACLMFSTDLDIMSSEFEQAVRDVYKKHGFNVETEEAFEAIAKKYEGDETFQKDVENGISGCLGDAFGNMDMNDEYSDEEFSLDMEDLDLVEDGTLEEEVVVEEVTPAEVQ